MRYGDDKRKLKELMEENREAYESIDSDTREMIEVMANVKIPEEYGRMVQENDREEKRYDMCKAFEDYRQEGVEEGIEQGIEKGRMDAARRMLQDGKLSLEKIALYSGLPLEKVRELAEPAMV